MNRKQKLAAILALSLAMSCFPVTASALALPKQPVAAPVVKDTLNWEDVITYENCGDHITIIGCDSSAVGDLVIPDKIEGLPVTSIENGTFSKFMYNSLTSITIPGSVTEISSNALVGCSNLTRIDVMDGNEVFSSIDGVLMMGTELLCYPIGKTEEHYVIPDNVTSIAGSAFRYCKNLTSVIIPDSVTGIDDGTFSGCSNLTSVTIPDSVTSIGNEAFQNCVTMTSITIPDSVTSIGSNAFSGCNALTSFIIPDGVTGIDNSTFSGCSNLTSVTIPDSVTSIGRSAFDNCQSLTSITIPDSVTSIGSHAFSGCTNLTSIAIPDGVTSIDERFFSGCAALTSITIPDSVTKIGICAFEKCTSLTSITIPDGVKRIDSSAFSRCTSLSTIDVTDGNTSFYSIDGILFHNDGILVAYPPKKEGTSYVIPDNITGIEAYAFSYCNNLTSVIIPDGVTEINQDVFSRCNNLSSVTIPNSVTTIYDGGFEFCIKLTDVYYSGTEEEWNAIEIGYSNSALDTATIHFNSTASDAPTEPTTDSTPEPQDIAYGDVDVNGTVNLVDVVLLNKNLMAGIKLTDQGKLNADVDADGTLTAVDSLNILKYCIELVTSFPVQ